MLILLLFMISWAISMLLSLSFKLIKSRKHFLCSLLWLEGMLITTVVAACSKVGESVRTGMLIIIMVLIVAEARLGLSILASMSRHEEVEMCRF